METGPKIRLESIHISESVNLLILGRVGKLGGEDHYFLGYLWGEGSLFLGCYWKSKQATNLPTQIRTLFGFVNWYKLLADPFSIVFFSRAPLVPSPEKSCITALWTRQSCLFIDGSIACIQS